MLNETLDNKTGLIAYLAATGRTTKQIAEAIGVSDAVVRDTLKDENVVFEIKHLRYKLFGKDVKKNFEDMLPHCQREHKKILDNPNTKPQLMFQAIQEVYDRALGKPKQTVEHEGSLLRSIYEQLTQPEDRQKEVVDIELPALENPNGRVEENFENNPNMRDAVDDWASKNL